MVRLSTWLPILWAIAIIRSIVSLVAFRSSELHGPDSVGQEVAGFVLPLIVAFVIGVAIFVTFRDGNSREMVPWVRALLATLVIGVCEVFIYCTFIMR